MLPSQHGARDVRPRRDPHSLPLLTPPACSSSTLCVFFSFSFLRQGLATLPRCLLAFSADYFLAWLTPGKRASWSRTCVSVCVFCSVAVVLSSQGGAGVRLCALPDDSSLPFTEGSQWPSRDMSCIGVNPSLFEPWVSHP